jgi:hypothetical protein
MSITANACCQSTTQPILDLQWVDSNSFSRQWTALNKQVADATRHNLLRILADLRYLPPLPVKVQYRISQSLPRLHSGGLVRLAVLLPDDIYSRLTIEHLLLNSLPSHAATDIQFFTSLDLRIALDWLDHGLPASSAPDLPARWLKEHQQCLPLRDSKKSLITPSAADFPGYQHFSFITCALLG